ncbi:hypothetical protein STSO111631_19985 [Stackebrandtia soli]
MFDAPEEPAKPEKPETAGQRINRLARVYTDRVKLSNFMAVQAIVRTAVAADYSDEQITAGLMRLTDEPERPVTANTLRFAIGQSTRKPAYAGPINNTQSIDYGGGIK